MPRNNRFWEEEVRFLCSPQAVEDEETYLLEHGQFELPHDQLVSRWQAMLRAKEWLESQFVQVDSPQQQQQPTTNVGCRSCLSEVCVCNE